MARQFLEIILKNSHDHKNGYNETKIKNNDLYVNKNDYIKSQNYNWSVARPTAVPPNVPLPAADTSPCGG